MTRSRPPSKPPAGGPLPPGPSEQQLAGVAAETRQAEEELERYFQAFEAGALSMATGAPRIEALSEKLRALQARRDELGDLIEAERGPELGPMDVAESRALIRRAVKDGAPSQRKALLQALVAEIRVTDRSCIQPVFRVVAAPKVREVDEVVRPAGIEPAAFGSGDQRSVR